MEIFFNGLVKENPTFVLTLGMCPTLAVTTSAINGLGMGLTTTAVLVLSNAIISLLRHQMVEMAGGALGIKKNGEKDTVAYAYTGEGGSSQGDTYEGMNFAGAFQAPGVFIIQNNGWAISFPRKLQTEAQTIAQKAVAAGIPGVQVDGMDVLACYEVAKEAREFAAAGNGPVLIETLTYRFGAHSSAGDDPSRYRTEDETKPWFDKDPLIRLRKYLTKKGLWSEEEEQKYADECKQSFKEAMKEADSVEPEKVSDMLKRTFEVPTPDIKEQIKKYEEKESK